MFYIGTYRKHFKRLLPLNRLMDFDQTLQECYLGDPLKVVETVPVHCTVTSLELKIDSQSENFKNLLVWNYKA
jgi:hypothetical protein